MSLFAEPRWTNAELAEVFGISAQRLGVLCKQGVLPLPDDGLHEPKKVVAAYVQHLKRKEEGASQAGESVRKLQLENEMRSLKLKRIAGELVPIDRAQRDWFESTRRVRDGFLNLPSRLSGVFAAEASQDKIFEMFTKEIHATLSELSSGEASQPPQSMLPLEDAVPTDQPVPPGAAGESASQQDSIVLKTTGMIPSVPGENAPIIAQRVIRGKTDSSDCQDDRFSTGD